MSTSTASSSVSHRPSRRSRIRIAWWTAIVLALAPLVVVSPAGAAADDPPTVVSLTWDDGNADQMPAADIMKAHNMAGTFYINSGTVGMAGYLTKANVASLAADGHEIGGHTLNHTSLPSLPADEAKRQICLDRANLTEWGYAVRSFAYPFAETTTAIDEMVRDCGYNSGRNLGDIKSRFGCDDCGYAESFTPSAPYETKAVDQVDSTWTLQDLQDSVTNAESSGGGWVQLTFHNFCGAVCGELSVTEQVFTEFLDWLQLRAASNNTTVKTVGDVIGGDVKPVVTVPDPVPTQDGSGLNNPGMETLSSTGLPSCWQKGGFGVNTAVLDTVTPGRTGQRAGRVTVTDYQDGDAKLLPSLDLGTCAPAATPGKSYVLRGWYTSTAPTQYDVYLRTAAGGWTYWTSSPYFAAAANYTQATWTTEAIPAGYTGISFGLNMFSNGTLVVDDFSLSTTDATPKTSATILPAAPDGAGGWYKTHPSVTLSVDAGSATSQTEYSLDGTTWTPYTAPISVPDGAGPLRYRSTSGSLVEETRTLDVKVDTSLPVVTPTFDKATRKIDATATDTNGSGVASIEKRVVGTEAWAPVTAPVVAGNEAAELEFRATDAAGNVSATVPLSVPVALVSIASITPGAPDGSAGWYFTRPQVTLTKVSGTPTSTIEYSLDGTTWTPYAAPIPVPDGTEKVSYRVVDGDEKEATNTLDLKVDTVKPVVTSTFDKATRKVEASATDSGAAVDTIEQRVNGGSWEAHTGPITLGDDAATVDFRATDKAGNVSETATVAVPATLITSASVSAAAPDGAAGWYKSRPTVTLTKVSGAASATQEYSFDGDTWTAYTGPIDVPDGTQTLRYRTVDGDDKEPAHALDLTVDTVNPVVTPTYDTSTRTVKATATDGTSGIDRIERRTAGGEWVTYTDPLPMGDEASSIEFRAVDKAGNVSEIGTVAVPAALIASASIAKDSPDGLAGWYVTRPKVTLTKASGAASATLEYSFDGTAWKAYTAPVDVPDGAQTLRYRTVDGDDKGATKTLAAKVDAVKPVISSATFDKTTRKMTVTATDATSTVDRVERRINGGAWATLSGPLAVSDDASKVEVRAFDKAGNESAFKTVTVPGRTAAKVGLSLSTTSTTYGKTVKATVAVPAPTKKAATPTGTVTVSVDGTALAPAKLVKGKAAVTLPGTLLSVASHTVSVTYSGNTVYRPGTAKAVKLTVKKATPTVSFIRSTTRPKVNKTVVKLTTWVSVAGTKVVPVGELRVYAAGKVIATTSLQAANKGKVKIALPVFTKRGTVALSVRFVSTTELNQKTSTKKSVKVVP
ncbi:MAG: hypothetical protein JWP56_2537 [Aeromicrobium sp.]|nr:hypothetical protein [Aeromicrobium sp.]